MKTIRIDLALMLREFRAFSFVDRVLLVSKVRVEKTFLRAFGEDLGETLLVLKEDGLKGAEGELGAVSFGVLLDATKSLLLGAKILEDTVKLF